MTVVAITGSLASGKSAVLGLMKEKGARVFDCDKVIRSYYVNKEGPVYQKTTELFPEAKGAGGSISRKKLSEIMYSDNKKKEILEGIVHPFIIKDLLRWVESARAESRLSFAEVPLLFEKDLARYFDYTVLVSAPRRALVERIKEKYFVSKEEAIRRLRHFMPLGKKKEQANFVVTNNLGLEHLQKEVELLWKKLREK
jgi:dephospho-CoA kinase